MRMLPRCVVFVLASIPLALQAQAGNASDENVSGHVEASHSSTAQLKLPPPRIAPGVPLSPRERAVQMLNRFAYGAGPGDVERVLAQGPDKWFEAQLNPAAIADTALDKRLGDYPTLNLSPEQILTVFPDRGAIQQVAEGKRPYPAEPLLASEYEVLVYKYTAEQADKLNQKVESSDADKAAAKKADQAVAARIAGELFALPKNARMAALNAMSVPDRISFATNTPNDQRNPLLADFTPRERETIYAMQGSANGAAYRAYEELSQARIVRSILSERQLQEVMTDFWFNHFNVFITKDSDQWYTTTYERESIRPHALGKFRDLLLATAESPAMMVYLDNYLSTGPNSLANGVNPKNPASKKGTRGLNENYGREVMELHTVGVNGGYSQADVTSLAAILTGWGVERPGQGGPFAFDAKKHEPGTKQWFGYTIDEDGNATQGQNRIASAPAAMQMNPPEGMKQGVAALSLLAASPKTAHFISYLLAQRFVADEPPAALVDRMTATYLSSDGDIKAVLRTLTSSAEFNSHRYFRNKVKTPTEFLYAAFRATATDPQALGPLVNKLRELGQPIYQALPPTGYYITADHWMNTQSLLVRLNFADQLTHGRFANQRFDAPRVLALSLMSDRDAGGSVNLSPGLRNASAMQKGTAAQPTATQGADIALHVLEATLISGEISPNTDRFIHGQLTQQPAGNPTETLNLLTALLLGSPEFQLR